MQRQSGEVQPWPRLIRRAEKSSSKVHGVGGGCLPEKHADCSDKHAAARRLPRKQLII